MNLADSKILHFHVRLQAIIDSLQINKKDAARIGNISPSSLSQYLKGISAPSQETLARWAAELNINLNWLLLEEGEMFRKGGAEEPQDDPQRVRELEQRVMELQQELLDARAELLTLYKEKAQAEGRATRGEHCVTARTAPTAAPLPPHGSESL
ncbi:helix-turn-helix domain-containing protein [Megalodesulfovibrio paquesii]